MMDIRKLIGLAVLGIAVITTGCGDDDGPSGDADGGAGTDAGPGEDTDLPAAQVGEIAGDDIDPATAMPADLSCMGTVTRPPEDTGEISFTFTVEDFQEGTPVPDLCVEFYPDNVVPLADTCSGQTTDASGQITVTDQASSWYAYRVFPSMGPTPSTNVIGSVQYNEEAPAAEGGNVTGNSVSQGTIGLITTVLGFRRAAGTAVLAGQAFDCAGDAIYGARIRVYQEDGTRILEGAAASAPHFRYFDGNDFPSSSQPWSHVDGLYNAANLPADAAGSPIFVELWGKTSADGEPQLLGCETGKLFPDTLTILNVGPKRSDGPTCPSEM